MKRIIHIYQQSLNKEIINLFTMLGSAFNVEKLEDNVLRVIDTDYYNEEPIDLELFRDLIIQDSNQNIVMIIEPYLEENFVLNDDITSFIKELKSGVYYFEDIITYAVVKNKEQLKKKIKKYITDNVKNEVLHTTLEFIKNNMNSSSTSKKLYMHRNTLNYRIDSFIELTQVNVRTFKGANAIYLLYKF